MDRLRRLAGTDRDHLGEMELKAGRVAEHTCDRREHHGMGDELSRGRRACDQTAGASGAVAREFVGPGAGGGHERRELVANAVHERRLGQAIDDRDTIAREHG